MDRRAMPIYLFAGLIGVGFVVWLFSSMASSSGAGRVLVTLAACFALVAVAGFFAMRMGGRDEHDDEPRSSSSS